MAWIESHQELANHPKTKRFKRALGISTPQAIGHLHLLWWWALDYAQDGSLAAFSRAFKRTVGVSPGACRTACTDRR